MSSTAEDCAAGGTALHRYVSEAREKNLDFEHEVLLALAAREAGDVTCSIYTSNPRPYIRAPSLPLLTRGKTVAMCDSRTEGCGDSAPSRRGRCPGARGR